jgi:hypothetical protein
VFDLHFLIISSRILNYCESSLSPMLGGSLARPRPANAGSGLQLWRVAVITKAESRQGVVLQLRRLGVGLTTPNREKESYYESST